MTARGMFTGNRGCVVDDQERVVRHHGSSLWIICRTEFRDWRWPLARPRRWTPLFFLSRGRGLSRALTRAPWNDCSGGVAAGATATLQVTVAGVYSAGTWPVTSTVDTQGTVVESSETNNSATFNTTVG
jgi:hypothetical protein